MTDASTATLAPPAPVAAPALLPVYEQLPYTPVRGEGVWLWDAGGRRVLDLWGGHAVALLGHGHPRLLAALGEQAAALMFQSNALPLAVRDAAAARLAACAPEGLGRVFFVNSGAEANENALLLALRHARLADPRRNRVVALEGAFHGRTAAAAAVSWGKHRHGFPQPPFAVTFVPRGDHEALSRALAAGDVAALIVEPVQGVAGAYELGRDYLVAARELTLAAGASLVFDEVQCGMGRTGHPFAAQLYGVTPDLLTVAKGLAGGFPAGAVLASEALVADVGVGDLGTTFGGGPLACALIVAVTEALAEPGFLERVHAVSSHLRAVCRVGPVVDVQGAGLLVGLRTAAPAKQVMRALLARGILTGTSADPHVLRLLPPLVLGEEHVGILVEALAALSSATLAEADASVASPAGQTGAAQVDAPRQVHP